MFGLLADAELVRLSPATLSRVHRYLQQASRRRRSQSYHPCTKSRAGMHRCELTSYSGITLGLVRAVRKQKTEAQPFAIELLCCRRVAHVNYGNGYFEHVTGYGISGRIGVIFPNAMSLNRPRYFNDLRC